MIQILYETIYLPGGNTMKKLATALILSAALLAPGLKAEAAPNQADLDAYLQSIHMTQAELEEYLNSYGDSISEYDSVAELKETLGEPLTEESLAAILKKYDYTEADVVDLAVYYDDMDENASLLATYKFTSDIEYLIELDQEDQENIEVPMDNQYFDILSKMGITENEINNVTAYLEKVTSEDPTIDAKMEALANRLETLSSSFEGDLTTGETPELTPEATAELANIIKEIQSTLKIDVKVSMELNGVKTPLSFAKLITMDENAAMEDAKFYLSIYDNNSNLLLDAFVSKDILLSDDFLGLVKDSEKAVKNQFTVTKTENGGKLPKTASHTTEWTLAGVSMLLIAFGLRRKAKINR